MSLKVWLDGKLVPKDDAKVSVYDHGLLYGDGVFEGIRAYNGRVFELEAHVKRLYESARSIRLEIPISPAECSAAIEQTVKANNFTDCYIRPVVTRGVGDLGIDPKKAKAPSVIIIADTIVMYPEEIYQRGMSAISSSFVRQHPNAANPRVKSLNYLNSILGKIEANDAGVHDAIMFNHLGNVSEMTAANIFLVKDGQVSTPTTACGILDGITRKVILKLCQQLAVPAQERMLQRHDVYIADEMFVTGTGAEVMPVTKVDGRKIGGGEPGPVTKRLREAFHQFARAASR